MIAPNSNVTPVFHFHADLTLDVGESKTCSIKFAEKCSVVGFGIVIGKREVSEDLANGTIKNLIVTLQHSDYDPLSKQQTQFKAQYKVSGRKNLANTFGLFQLGRKVLLSGNICGYDKDKFMWTINTIAVSIASGHQTSGSLQNLAPGKTLPVRQRPGLISLEDRGSTSSKPIQINDKAKAVSHNLYTSESAPVTGKGNSQNYYKTILSTASKKRTRKDILADAKRAKKYLCSPADTMPVVPEVSKS
ncbi:hypothetical protein PTTG_28242 [Puccinia triticina 1-1 BBBD Race 1]|uniref:Uncharacterized protein n=1 Tax=Puccinia triticina (isolate 1-1 / race 1 (BBBD)) TaxID=630390 RepID=A0A180GD81_PUCT1|nr:hypothetical protein PTTG_28242 [Puccinia triticina 1-1 BBBD Race 1]WAR52213.1 hypothetical protein PtB15_1B654 [Puccinia triticina]